MQRLAIYLLVAHLAATVLPAEAGDQVVVQTKSGRKFRGEVDLRTNAASLALRTGRTDLSVRRQIRWDQIESVTVGESVLAVPEFREQIASPAWKWAENGPSTNRGTAIREAEEIAPASWTTTEEPIAAPPLVTSVRIEAYLANWDSDVEPDGLQLHVYPLDAYGATVPAYGTIEADLTGNATTNLVAGDPFPDLGHWTQVMRPEDVGPNGAVYRLPFQAIHPDFELRRGLGSYGMVHARLSVGGQGTFDDTASFTRIRSYSPTRDRLQQFRGTRYLPQERNGRGVSWDQ